MPTIAPDARATIYTSMGEFTFELLTKKAPRTVENFCELVHKGHYEGLTFHRILKDFVIQGGCPKGDGSGGSGHTIRPEFNDTPHVLGTVSMARDHRDPHSASSQFFVCAGEARYLDSRFSAFGQVVDGLETVEKIASVKTHDANRFKEKSTPLDPVYINRIELEGVEFEPEAPAAEPAPAADEPAEEAPKGKRRRGGKRQAEADESAEADEQPEAEEKPKRARKTTRKARSKKPADDEGAEEAAEKKPRRPRRKTTKKKSDDAEQE